MISGSPQSFSKSVWRGAQAIETAVNIQFENFSLKSIIWHSGQSVNSGHYTSSVKRNGKWYLTNDQDIREFRKFHSTSSDALTPYLLIYQRSQLAECHTIQSHVENHQIADLHVKDHLEVLLEENQSINPMVKKDLSSYFSDQILKTSAQRKRDYRSKEPSKITKERKEKAREYIKEKRSA